MCIGATDPAALAEPDMSVSTDVASTAPQAPASQRRTARTRISSSDPPSNAVLVGGRTHDRPVTLMNPEKNEDIYLC
jgi:hypothetical protein